MADDFDDRIADTLLTDEEQAEMHHIQHHFTEVEDENERALLGWRATSIYVAAFKREIVRLRQITDALDEGHSSTNCRCGHGNESHHTVTVCTRCAGGAGREVILTGEFE